MAMVLVVESKKCVATSYRFSPLPDINGWTQGYEDDVSIIRDCYCPACNQGHAVTTMLPTKIPLFREIIIMSLTCPDCNFRNSEVNFGGEIQEKGERISLTVSCADDLNRQIIKSDSASLRIPHLEFEIPPSTQRGMISTLEGVLLRAASNLEELQPERLRLGDVDNFHRCRRVICELRRLAGQTLDDVDSDDGGETKFPAAENPPVFPFHVILDDPAGNSFIEDTQAPQPDTNLVAEQYFRTANQDMSLGLQPSKQALEDSKIDDFNPLHKNIANVAAGQHSIQVDPGDDATTAKAIRQEVHKFPTTCSHCHAPAETNMCFTNIPHFKEVIIMSLLCENCGFKSNEIKGGGAIPRFGTKIVLRVQHADDLAREVLKSDTSGIAIPELDLEMEEGGLDGVYSTVEGLLNKMHDRLKQANPFGSGDAAAKQHLTNDGGAFSEPSPNYVRYNAFLQKLKGMADGASFPFTMIISDPLSNSFVGPIPKDAIALSLKAEKEGNNDCYEAYVDAALAIEEYERSHEQNEILGINDMKTENYQTSETKNYGTDVMSELPDRIAHLDVRGPDHPHEVGKAPVEGDTTVMGAKSANFAIPTAGLRGKMANVHAHDYSSDLCSKLLRDLEHNDVSFMMSETFDGSKVGFTFKDGAQGLGYYQNLPLLELWNRHHADE
ncbi:hypothetical protein MPSEU_000719200 [Mayamaea pseudoterrestris]|nr:hypothetical protein MPSEU_000719200 [Mayamaea pseudoterrestris]